MDWESESDGELDVEHEHPPAEIIPMPIEPGNMREVAYIGRNSIVHYVGSSLGRSTL